MARCPEQHRLFLEARAGLAVLQNALDDEARLIGLIAHGDELRLCGGRPLGPEVFRKSLLREADDAVGGGENGLRRTIIAIQRDDAGGRRELAGKVQDVAHGRGAERIDRLGIVADHREAAAAGFQRQQDRGLQAVGVLVFVDQHVIEAAADVVGQGGVADHLRPVEQQVVVIEHVLLLLGLDIGREQFLQFGRPAGTPGIRGADAPARSASRR